MTNLLTWLENWYLSNCDGDWEHDYGISIQTLDNPGWIIKIKIVDTKLEARFFQKVNIERSESDWLYCSVEKGIFRGAGGPRNLQEILTLFYRWASAD